MTLQDKIKELEKAMQGHNFSRFATHGFILWLALIGAVLQSYPAENPKIMQQSFRQQASSSPVQSIDNYLASREFALSDNGKKSRKFSALSAKSSGTAEQYQVLAKKLTVRESPKGKVKDFKSIGDIFEVRREVFSDGVIWGETSEGYIALSEESRSYSEEILKTTDIAITPSAVNYLKRLLWTEVIPYAGYPEDDYKTAIMNILNVIDNRAMSGVFPQTVLGAAVVDSQFSGLTDAKLKLLLKEKNGIDMKYDKLTVEELMKFYSVKESAESVTAKNMRKKLLLIEEVMQDYLKNGIRNHMPADVLFFKNTPEKWDGKRWHDPVTGNYLFTTVYVRSDPGSIPKHLQHDYYRRVVETGLRKR